MSKNFWWFLLSLAVFVVGCEVLNAAINVRDVIEHGTLLLVGILALVGGWLATFKYVWKCVSDIW